MHHDQLDRTVAAIVVGHQPVRHMHACRWRDAIPATEMDGIELLRAMLEVELEMAFADDAPTRHIEFAIEQRLRIALPPMATVAQRQGRIDGEVAVIQRAIA